MFSFWCLEAKYVNTVSSHLAGGQLLLYVHKHKRKNNSECPWIVDRAIAAELQVPGLVNVDFADVRAIMANAGSSLMGIGTATGWLLLYVWK